MIAAPEGVDHMTDAAGHHHRIAAAAQEVWNNHPAVAAGYIVIAEGGILE